MDIEQVDVDLRTATLRLPATDPSKTAMRRISGIALKVMPVKRAPGVRVRTVRDGAARVRLYEPAERRTDAALLWIHGGGLVIGDPRMDERLMSETAATLGLLVVSVYYRLAPEHPFPAAHDDAHAAWTWLQANAASLGVDPARVVVGGESAGGGLAAGLVQRLHDEGAHPLGQWLFCPMLDDRTAADRSLDAVGHFIWDNTANRFGWASYLGEEPGATEAPAYAVPARREELAGLPPAWICVSDIELFHDEDADYARHLETAGVPVTLDLVARAPHGFESWATDTPPARALIARAHTWLADRVGVSAPTPSRK